MMSNGLLGCMTTPAQGNTVPDGALWAADNGKFGKGWPGADAWFIWLRKQVARYGESSCLWAVAPDVPFDATETLRESLPWLADIRSLGIPAAFAAQDGCEHGLIPWDGVDVLFLAGSTEWKIGPAGEQVAREARDRGLNVHMARVNSQIRLRVAEWFGCSTADGTWLAFGPDVNLPVLMKELDRLRRQPSLFGVAESQVSGGIPPFAPLGSAPDAGIRESDWTVRPPRLSDKLASGR